MSIRTRIAPSPTGDPHVGTAYIALFNYCFAKHNGGEFILRIEDTDQVRSTAESEQRILKALRWVGITWDEGPDVGGPHGPYRQSERSAMYREHAQILLDQGHAFRCFCTRERLDAVRAEQKASGAGFFGYDGHCTHIDPAESKRRADAGETHVIRMKVPREGNCTVQDFLRDDIEIAWREIDMQVLLKSDGLPTYHLANVVDDHHMQITHVLRGEEWINSAPKHLLLYQYFGWEPPVLCHLPLLRNPDGSKLSKRKNPTSILYFERMGFLPEALLNYLGMMGWTMPDGTEKFDLPTMVEHFELARVSLGGPVFDVEKLSWLNGKYIREDFDVETEAGLNALADRVARWAVNRDYMVQLLPMVHKRIDRLSDLGPMLTHFFAGDVEPDAADLVPKKLDEKEALKVLQFIAWQLDALTPWNRDTIEATLRETADLLETKFRNVTKPLFVAMSGKTVSTPLFDTMHVLGPDISRARVRTAIETLAGGKPLSKNKLKKIRKAYQSAIWKRDNADA